MAEVTGDQLQKEQELNQISIDLEGVRKVQTLYGNMLTSEYKSFLLADRDELEAVRATIDAVLKEGLRENTNGKKQFVMIVNGVTENTPLIYMNEGMKNSTIDQFKGVIPILDDDLETQWASKKAELDAL